MIRFWTGINKGDLVLVSRYEQDNFDGVVGMVAKRDLFHKSHSYGSTVGRPQGYGQCIVFNMDDFEPLGNFRELTGFTLSNREVMAVSHSNLIIPDHCKWIINDLYVGWERLS